MIEPTYNRARLLKVALANILNQALLTARIFIVDDGSTDDTADAVSGMARRVEYVRQENRSKAAANRTLDMADAPWAWIFDDDDISLPGAVEALMAALNGNPDTAFTYSPFYFATEGNTPEAPLMRSKFIDMPDTKSRGLFQSLMFECSISLQSVVFSIAAAKKIGAKVITNARYAVFQMAEVAAPRDLFGRILDMIDDPRPRKPAPC